MRTRVKVCCMASAAEVRAAVEVGTAAIGVMGEMPSGPGPVDFDTQRRVVAATPPGVTPVLLTATADGRAIAEEAVALGVRVVQTVRHLPGETLRALRRVAPKLKVIQVVHVEGADALELARAYAELADALLLDSGPPGAEVAELGGTGRAHDWAVSARIVASVDKPVWLAGGLTALNVGAAIAQVSPFGVDLCNGVRTLGKLDVRKLSAFMNAVRQSGG